MVIIRLLEIMYNMEGKTPYHPKIKEAIRIQRKYLRFNKTYE